MPFRRLLPALAAAAVFVVLGTAQRLVLAWLLWPHLDAGLRAGAEGIAFGARVDLACAAAVVLPAAAWCSLLPERAWAARAHRGTIVVAFGAALLGAVTFLTVDAIQFLTHRARLGPPVRQRLLVAWADLSGESDRMAVLAVTALGCLVATVALGVALRHAVVAAFREAVPPVVRARDLVLTVAACMLALALAPPAVRFPGQPVLTEISRSSAPDLARRAWARAQGWAR